MKKKRQSLQAPANNRARLIRILRDPVLDEFLVGKSDTRPKLHDNGDGTESPDAQVRHLFRSPRRRLYFRRGTIFLKDSI